MKYYATQIGTDPEGAPTILKQIEIGAPLTNYWEMRNVCDSNGNTYYSYGSKVGKIDVSTYAKTEIDVNTALTLTNYEVVGLAINRDETYLYILINDIYNSIAGVYKFYRISLATFTLGTGDLYKDVGDLNYINYFQIDADDNIWFAANAHNDSNFFMRVLESNGAKNIISSTNILWDRSSPLALEQRNGIGYTQCSYNNTWGYKHIYDNSLHTITSTRTYLDGTYFIELCLDKDNCIWRLQNQQNGTTQNSLSRIINLTGTPSVGTTINVTKEDLATPLYYCYNLHTNSNGDIFFSSYHPVDGYNIYKIAYGTTTITKYFSGLGSKTTGNDPYAFFLSQYGHTGANI